jgi:hypothetical protein
MRKIELQTVEDIHVLYVDGDPTNIQYTKDDMNFMLDDLALSFPARSRDDILTELIERSSAKANLLDGPFTADELKTAVKLVRKSCKSGWF